MSVAEDICRGQVELKNALFEGNILARWADGRAATSPTQPFPPGSGEIFRQQQARRGTVHNVHVVSAEHVFGRKPCAHHN